MLSTPASIRRSGSSRFDDGARARLVAGGVSVMANSVRAATCGTERCSKAVMTPGHFGDTITPARATGDPTMSRLMFAALVLPGPFTTGARAQDAQRSECLAMAGAPPRATPVSLRREAKADDVAITYGGHSTYYIDTPGGVRIATDYSGGYRIGRLP